MSFFTTKSLENPRASHDITVSKLCLQGYQSRQEKKSNPSATLKNLTKSHESNMNNSPYYSLLFHVFQEISRIPFKIILLKRRVHLLPIVPICLKSVHSHHPRLGTLQRRLGVRTRRKRVGPAASRKTAPSVLRSPWKMLEMSWKSVWM